MKFGVDAWRQTFPNDEYIAKQKMEKAREAAKKLKEMEEQIANYTEEELEAVIKNINISIYYYHSIIIIFF